MGSKFSWPLLLTQALLSLQSVPPLQLWVIFAQGESLWLFGVYDLCHFIGQEKVNGSLFSRAHTGCGSVSNFCSKGKKLLARCDNLSSCNGGYFSETSLRPRIPPARPRDPVIHIKPQAPKARGYCCRCLIRIQVRNKEQSLSPEPRLNGECWDTVTLAQSALNWSG